MPKEIHEIKTFVSGTITTPDAKDIPEDAAESSLNIDPTSSDGKIMGIGNDVDIGNIIEEFTSDSMGIINVNGKRMLIGVDERSNEIKSIEAFYTEDNSIVTNSVDSINESSIVIDDNQAYIGLGKESSSRPKFAGIVSNKPFGRGHDGILVEDAEVKRYLANYYGIRKIATTICATSVTGETPTGNTGTTEDDYVWGVAPGENFLFRIDINDGNVEGTITASNYIKYSNGINITSKINSIATCISQNNMLWATTDDGRILRLHVNAVSLAVTVQLDIKPHFSRPADVGSSTVEGWNFYNQPPPTEAILSDIIEARSPNDDDGNAKYDLIISYWKEDGFLPNESYIYRRHIAPYDSSDTVSGEELLNPFIIDASVLDVDDDSVVTQYSLEEVLFKDISVIFSECSTVTTHCDGLGEVEIAHQVNSDEMEFLGSRLSSGTSKSTVSQWNPFSNNNWVDYDWNELVPYGSSFACQQNLNYSAKDRFDHKVDGDGNAIKDDNDNYIPVYDSRNGNHIIKGAIPYQNSNFSAEGYRYIMGRNIGFHEGFKLYVHRFGLINLENTATDNNTIKDDVYVGLFAYSDRSFYTKAGTVRAIYFPSYIHHNDATFGRNYTNGFFGEEELEKVNLNNGFFITINSTKKYYPRIRHNLTHNPTDTGFDNGHPDFDGVMAVASIAYDNINPLTGVVGTTNIARLSTNEDSGTAGGFSTLVPANIDSISMDRFGNRATTVLTTTSNYKTSNTNENLCFIAEALNEGGSDAFDATKFWSINFGKGDADEDGLLLAGGTSYTQDGISYASGIDIIKQGEQSDGTYMESKKESNLGGACIFPVFDSATTVGGQGSNDFAIWYFSLYSTDTNNYSNGVMPIDASSAYNDWGTLREDITSYSLISFEDIEGTAGDNQFQEDAEFSYKLALVYDNGAVSPLTKQQWKHTPSSDYLKSVFVTLNISPDSLSKRVTAIQLYRRGGTADGELDGQWTLALNDIQLSSGWSPIDNNNEEAIYVTITVIDYNSNLGAYEDISGIEVGEVTEHTLPSYSLSTVVNGSNIIGKCFLPNFDDLTNMLFKSNIGRYNHFNIASELNFLKLPTTPTGIKGFAGRLFAFDENNTYIINTNGMVIEDELEGIGCLGKNSVITTEFGMFFADDSNIYQYDGQKTIPLANSILKSNTNTGWLQRRKDFNPIVGFDGSKLSLVVIHRQHHTLTEEEVQEVIAEILTGDNPDNLTIFDIIESLDPYYAWVYNLRLKRWDMWKIPNGVPLSMVAGKDGELIISTTKSLVFYGTNLDDRRNWEWISKHITLGEDGKYKKFYSIVSTSTSDTNSFIEYKVDGKEFKPLTENDLISSEDRKAKIMQIKLNSVDDDLEVDSLSLSYRRLPNSTNNV